jgi:cell division protein FtsZ
MTINLSAPQLEPSLKPRITVLGVGGAGGNAIDNMIGARLEGVEFAVANTDAQALERSLSERRIQLGSSVTRGLGAGSRPEVGRAAAEETIEEILEHLEGSNMVFITAGLGGGTGTGAAPVIARAARELGILTVGVVTKPFHFEGAKRMRIAEAGLEDIQQHADTLIVIPNQNLFRVANEATTFADAFRLADEVLYSGVRGVTDLMVMPGLINLDFADIRTVMSEMGKAMMGTGEGEGKERALEASEAAISNPLIDDVSMKGARSLIVNITGGSDLTLFEVDAAANRIREEADPEANIIFGSTFDEGLEGKMRVSIVATGIDAKSVPGARPTPLSLVVNQRPRQKPATETETDSGTADSGQADLEPADSAQADAAPRPAIFSVEEEAKTTAVPRMEAEADTRTDQEERTVGMAPAADEGKAREFATESDTGKTEPLSDAAQMASETGSAVTVAAPATTEDGTESPEKAREKQATSTEDRQQAVKPHPDAQPKAALDPPFIAPPPAEPSATAALANRTRRVADAKAASRRPSLFERMTGTGRARKMPIEGERKREADSIKMKMGDLFGERAAAKAGPPEEDLLEIPAFLRRQAN